MVANKIPVTELSRRIQQLVDERQRCADTIARIDIALAGVDAAIDGFASVHPKAKSAAVAGTKIVAPKRGRRRKQGKFAMSGQDSILAFVKQHKNPTTQEIKKHWEEEGRGGRADTYLIAMVKERKLKRTPLEDGTQGSRYSRA